MLLPVKAFKMFVLKFSVAVGLSAENDRLIYVPKGFA